MKYTFTTLLIIVFIVLCSIGFAQNKVAVLLSQDKSNSGFADIMREMLSTGISKSDYYTPITNALVDKVLKESNYTIVEVGDDDMISKLGKKVGADFVCVSMIQKVGSNFFITAKLVNAKTSAVGFQEYLRTEKGEEDLFDKVDELVKMISNVDLNSAQGVTAANDSLTIVEIDFLEYMIMPRDFDNEMNYTDAKHACSDLNAYGHDDWFLPTRDQLNGVFLNSEKIGGFNAGCYWSMSSVSPKAYMQNFSNGDQQSEQKEKELFVRCIRRNY